MRESLVRVRVFGVFSIKRGRVQNIPPSGPSRVPAQEREPEREREQMSPALKQQRLLLIKSLHTPPFMEKSEAVLPGLALHWRQLGKNRICNFH